MRRLRVPGYGFQLTQGLLDSGAIVLVLFLVLLRSASAQPTLAHTVIPDNYIVFLKDNVANLPQVASDMARQHGFSIDEQYDESMEMLGIIDELR